MQNNSDTYILIIWDSMTGGSQAIANAAYEGATLINDTLVKIRHANDISIDDMLNAAGYIFAFPENLAAISGVMKAFFDRLYYPCLGYIEGRPYALMICAGSDGESAKHQAMRICKGWRLKPIHDGLIIKTYAQTTKEILSPKIINSAELQKCHDIGASMSAGVSIGIY